MCLEIGRTELSRGREATQCRKHWSGTAHEQGGRVGMQAEHPEDIRHPGQEESKNI